MPLAIQHTRESHLMDHLDGALFPLTVAAGFGGAILAQITTQPAGLTWATVALALIGLGSMWVRSHYALLEKQMHAAELEAELKVYRDRDRLILYKGEQPR